MPAELLLQHNMFTGELVDTRSPGQRRRDLEADQPRQIEMFSQRDLAQYVPRPMMPLSADMHLVLVQEDPRTEEEKERDREVAARALTAPMFAISESSLMAQIPPGALSTDAHEDDDGPETVKAPIADPESRRADATAELERVVRDITQTTAAAPEMLCAQSMWLALATVEAQTAGVPKDEVMTILHRLEGAAPPRVYSELPAKREANTMPQPVLVFQAEHDIEHLPMTIF